MKKNIFENRWFSNIFKKIFPEIFLKYFCIFELARQFSMFTDFVINFDLKNDWVIAVWKFQLWITFQQFSTYIWQIDPKLKFSNGYNSVIFKVKIFDKISRHWELPREFKNAKTFQKNFWEYFLKNIWKSAIFKNIFFQLLKIANFQIFFKKSFQSFFWTTFAVLNLRGNAQCLLIFS